MNRPKYIVIHHTAVSYDKNPDQFEASKSYHISKGWGDIAYHYTIAKNGLLHRGRAELTAGAHTKEANVNFESIAICLDGNFDVELPTAEQIKTLGPLLDDISKRYKIPISNILPHRHWATYKSCPGKRLKDEWGQQVLQNHRNKTLMATNAKLVKDKNSAAVGFWLPAANGPALISFAKNLGIDLPALPNGDVDWKKVKEDGFVTLN